MTKDDIAKRVAAALETEFGHYRNAELQHITAVNDGQQLELQALPVPTDDESREAFKDQRLNWWRGLFAERVTLDQAAGMLLGFSQVMAMNAKFVDAHEPKSKDPKEPPPKSRAPSRPVSPDLVKAFTDRRADIADWRTTSNGTYRVDDLIEWAKGKDFVADEVLAEWEAYNKAEAGEQAEAKTAPTSAPGNEPKPKPLQAGRAQDEVILATIRKMGHNPLQLPKPPAGKPGVKAEVRKALLNDSLFTGGTVFKKAWERLSELGDIVYAKVSP